MKYTCLAAALATMWLAPNAKAAQIAASDTGAILISGRIALGDASRFSSLLSSIGGRGDINVQLNSSGGLLQEAVKIAEIVRNARLTTRVSYRATCASACTLIFAAGSKRIAHAVSRIAVHSAGMPSQSDLDQRLVENEQSLAVTTKFARLMSEYGAPSSVIAKLVTTPTDRTSFLTVADLEAWNVEIIRAVPGTDIATAGEQRQPLAPLPAPSSATNEVTRGKQVKTEPIKIPLKSFDPIFPTARFQPPLPSSKGSAAPEPSLASAKPLTDGPGQPQPIDGLRLYREKPLPTQAPSPAPLETSWTRSEPPPLKPWGDVVRLPNREKFWIPNRPVNAR